MKVNVLASIKRLTREKFLSLIQWKSTIWKRKLYVQAVRWERFLTDLAQGVEGFIRSVIFIQQNHLLH